MGIPANHPAVVEAQRRGLIEMEAAAKRNKYGSRATVVDGVRFDSRKEAKRWQLLKAMEESGEITRLRRQVRFDLAVNGIAVCAYVADAVYERGGATVVEDVKSAPTRRNRAYRIKRKLMRAVWGIEIQEV